jgi:2'-5' RNA ligase
MRLFIALTLPPQTVAMLSELQTRLPAGRPVAEENMHLTLSFLGDQPQSEVECLHDSLTTLRAPSVSLTLAGAALFGGARGQAAGLEADGGAGLNELHDRIRGRVRSAGLNMERRRFRPHVTLARMKGGSDASGVLAALAGVEIGPVVCNGFALMESTLHRDGAIYETLAAYPLQ